MVIFTQPEELDYMEIVDADTTLAENQQDNGSSLPLGTQPYLMHSPLTEISVSLDELPPHLRVEAGDTTVLACTSDLL